MLSRSITTTITTTITKANTITTTHAHHSHHACILDEHRCLYPFLLVHISSHVLLDVAVASLCYSADGSLVLAGGLSKYVCIYANAPGLLVRKFQLSHNRSLDGVLDKLNSSAMTPGGLLHDIDMDGSDDERDKKCVASGAACAARSAALRLQHLYDRVFVMHQSGVVDDVVDDDDDDDVLVVVLVTTRADQSLPGVQQGDLASRKVRPEIRCDTARVVVAP